MEVVTYSLINVIFWSPWVLRIARIPLKELSSFELTAAMLCICLISPTLLALIWHRLRTSVLHRTLRLDHPTPRSWDFFVRNNREFWVLFHFKNGKMSGAYFGENSYASTYPQEPELYVEAMWRVNEHGEFVEQVEGTLGGIIRQSECERVEFFKIQLEGAENGLQPQGNDQESRANGGPAGAPESRTDGQVINDAGGKGKTTAGRIFDCSTN